MSVSEKMSKLYMEAQNEWIEENNVNIGDTVKITHSVKSHTMGWNNTWIDVMDQYVNNNLYVEDISISRGVDAGIRLSNRFRYPFFVLEIVQRKEPKSKEYTFSTGQSVLVRDDIIIEWKYDIFSHESIDDTYPYVCVGSTYMYCIPYEGNENLVGRIK